MTVGSHGKTWRPEGNAEFFIAESKELEERKIMEEEEMWVDNPSPCQFHKSHLTVETKWYHNLISILFNIEVKVNIFNIEVKGGVKVPKYK